MRKPPPRRRCAALACLLLCPALLLASCRPESPVSGESDGSGDNSQAAPAREYRTLENAALYQTEPDGTPRIMPTSLESEDTPIAVYNAVQFGAKGDGVTDDTVAIHKAMMAALEDGGGTVFLPAGTYSCQYALTIPRGVTLRGEWAPPGQDAAQGTLLLCGYGEEEKDQAFITMKEPSGLKNLAVYYPNQDFRDPVAYTPTIHCAGRSAAVENVTLYNPYIGIQIGDSDNELHHIRNVYITPLYRGITIDKTTDVGRIQDLHIGASYYAECGFAGAPASSAEQEALRALLKKQADGIVIGRSDWQYMAYVDIRDMNRGIVLQKSTTGSNGQLYGFHFADCGTAWQVNEIYDYGWAAANGTITGCGTGFAFADTFRQAVVISDVAFADTALPVSCKGFGQVSLANARFEGWDPDGCAIAATRGAIVVQNSAFLDAAVPIQATGATSLGLAGCTFADGSGMQTPALCYQEEQQAEIPAVRERTPSYPYKIYGRLYNVLDFGAVNDGLAECAAAFQRALDQAAADGGGVVYVPAGEYRLSETVTIPSGVELRGSMDVEYHSASTGSMLSCTMAPGTSAPLIAMQADSSLRGLTFCYPEQTFPSPAAYGFTIRGQGDALRIKDVTFINSYNGIDLQTHRCDGFFISYAAGCFIRTGIQVGGGSAGGVIENCQFNPHYWMRTPAKIDKPVENTGSFQHFVRSLTCFAVGDAPGITLFDNFSFTGYIGLRFFAEEGRGAGGLVIGHGADSTATGVQVENAGELTFLNTQLVNLNNEEPGAFLRISGGESLRFVNTLLWGTSEQGIQISGGDTALHQTTVFPFGGAIPAVATVSGGIARFSALRYENADAAFAQTGGTLDAWFPLSKDGRILLPGADRQAVRWGLKTP